MATFVIVDRFEERCQPLNQVFFFSMQGNFSVNGKYLRALTLEGPTKENPVLDSLAVQHLNNQLYSLLPQGRGRCLQSEITSHIVTNNHSLSQMNTWSAFDENTDI